MSVCLYVCMSVCLCVRACVRACVHIYSICIYACLCDYLSFQCFDRGNPFEPVFKQVAEQVLSLKPPESLLLTKVWKVKLVNEAADDAGGVFDEVVTHMCTVSIDVEFDSSTKVLSFCLLIY